MEYRNHLFAAAIGALLALVTHSAHAQSRESIGLGPAQRVTPQLFAEFMRDQQVPSRALRFRYIFVPGFLNEGLPGYFADNIAELRRLGVPESHIQVLAAGSRVDPASNARTMGDELQSMASLSSEKIVLIGHSKGAVETLMMAVNNPQFVEENVQAIFLIQGAFGGSGVADYLTGAGRPFTDKMPIVRRIAFEAAANAGELVTFIAPNGLNALVRSTSLDSWSHIRAEHTDAIKRISKRVFYIQGREYPAQMAGILCVSGWYLHTSYGDNDGLVAVADQRVPGIGTSLGVLTADHADLVLKSPVSNAPAALRQQLMHGILDVAAMLQ